MSKTRQEARETGNGLVTNPGLDGKPPALQDVLLTEQGIASLTSLDRATLERDHGITIFDLVTRGIPPETARKLLKAGYFTAEAVAAAPVLDLLNHVKLSPTYCRTVIKAAFELAGPAFRFKTALQMRGENSGNRATTFSTGCFTIDDLLGGEGLPTRSITHLAGESGSGKTYLCHEFCITVQLYKQERGLREDPVSPDRPAEQVKVMYIDTEGSFSERLVIHLGKEKHHLADSDIQELLANIIHVRVTNSLHLCEVIKQVISFVSVTNVKLVIIDPFLPLFLAEYTGKGDGEQRDRLIRKQLSALLRMAEVNDLAVAVTNHVYRDPGVFAGDATKHVGGHLMDHYAARTLFLRRSKGNARIARVIGDLLVAEKEALFSITDRGIEDAGE